MITCALCMTDQVLRYVTRRPNENFTNVATIRQILEDKTTKGIKKTKKGAMGSR
jgi:hypothetical protein